MSQAIEKTLNVIAIILFGMRLCVGAVGLVLLLPSVGLFWIYAKMGGEA